MLLYADDTIIMAESPHELQSALDATFQFCSDWQLTINTLKTKIVIFSRGMIRNKPVFTYGGNALEIVNEYTYLGVTMNYNGKFNKAIAKQVDQARRAMYGLISKCKKLNLPLDLQFELFNQLVLPILLYGCEVWGFQDLSHIERFHRKFLKQTLKLNRNTPSCMVYGESGQFNLFYIIYQRMINYWIRIHNSKESKLSHIMYRLMYHMHNENAHKFKWISQIKHILDYCGFSNMFMDISTVNTKWLKKSIELKLNDICVQNWQSDVNTNNVCLNYRIFKTEPGIDKYMHLNDHLRITLTKFRCRNHKLPM